jgi:DNA (cytosine-5)-methyltransferase 1
MKHGSLFSGIGGFDLAAEWAGWENVFHCEWNPFGQRVLKHHFPKSISYNDITKTDFTIHKGNIEILSGGFPCQPYSTAGLRKGKEDERHLWPQMLRAIREIKPSWVVGENVRGLINWGGGLVFDEVQTELEAEGYEVLPFLLPACAVNAPHRRDRIWFIAYANNKGGSTRPGQVQSKNGEISEWYNDAESCDASSKNASNPNSIGQPRKEYGKIKSGRITKEGKKWITTDTDIAGIHEQHITSKSNESKQYSGPSFEARSFGCFPTKPPVCGGNDGISRELDGITFSKWRNESIKAYGNAIVPQVAYEIFKTIKQIEHEKRNPRP